VRRTALAEARRRNQTGTGRRGRRCGGQAHGGQILALDELLVRMTENPVFRLNRAVAIGTTRGPSAGLPALDALAADERLDTHRLPAVRGHLLEMAGDPAGARTEYLRAAQRTRSAPERRYLEARAARL
jgi:predicted RNA polymerase sigma factor